MSQVGPRSSYFSKIRSGSFKKVGSGYGSTPTWIRSPGKRSINIKN